MRRSFTLWPFLLKCRPVAGRNLALRRPSEQSSTLWNYISELATDGDPDTCSFTPKSSGQRWWQVDLQDEFTVQAIAVTVAENSYQHFTIFIIGSTQFQFDFHRLNFVSHYSPQRRMKRTGRASSSANPLTAPSPPPG